MVDAVKAKGRGFWRWVRGNPVQTAVAVLVLAGAGATAAISASPTVPLSGSAVGYAVAPTPSTTPPSAPSGAVSHSSASSSTQTGTASATNDGTTVTATGIGGITVSQFSGNPVASPTFSATDEYFDIRVSSGNTFTSIVVKNCTLSGGNTIYWFNPSAGTSGAWQSVSGQVYSAGPPACVSFTITAVSSPSLSQLTGTVFGVGTVSIPPVTVAPSVTSISPTSGPASGGTTVTVSGTNFTGATAVDFGTTAAKSFTVASATSITALSPAGSGTVNVTVTTPTGTSPVTSADQFTYVVPPTQGYWEATSGGDIYSFGNAPFYGSTGAIHLNQPVVGMASNPVGGGYWLVARDGGVFSFGTSHFYGSLPGLPASEQPGLPVVGMAATANGGGYWEVTSGGDVYSFGDAKFSGSTGNLVLNKPVVGMAAVPGGGGYWLVAQDGGLFAFGDAAFEGSLPGLPASKQPGLPVVAMAAS